eukprot:scaffold97630_cov69-Phaeocystis_antarctica.AAC.7
MDAPYDRSATAMERRHPASNTRNRSNLRKRPNRSRSYGSPSRFDRGRSDRDVRALAQYRRFPPHYHVYFTAQQLQASNRRPGRTSRRADALRG